MQACTRNAHPITVSWNKSLYHIRECAGQMNSPPHPRAADLKVLPSVGGCARLGQLFVACHRSYSRMLHKDRLKSLGFSALVAPVWRSGDPWIAAAVGVIAVARTAINVAGSGCGSIGTCGIGGAMVVSVSAVAAVVPKAVVSNRCAANHTRHRWASATSGAGTPSRGESTARRRSLT